jgi:3-deoxy-D-manno-octulosonate 8-phosphate phosphatase (KDO 8-P phosphatase)
MTLAERCRGIELLLLDVDGVLSEGNIIHADNGVEIKNFFVRDGSGLAIWRHCGKQAALLSGRASGTTTLRARELHIEHVLQGSPEKLPRFRQLLATLGIRPEQVCFIGDDVPDVPILSNCGLAVAVADACPELLRLAHYVARAPGGRGAAREVIELLLRCQGLWHEALFRLYGVTQN